MGLNKIFKAAVAVAATKAVAEKSTKVISGAAKKHSLKEDQKTEIKETQFSYSKNVDFKKHGPFKPNKLFDEFQIKGDKLYTIEFHSNKAIIFISGETRRIEVERRDGVTYIQGDRCTTTKALSPTIVKTPSGLTYENFLNSPYGIYSYGHVLRGRIRNAYSESVPYVLEYNIQFDLLDIVTILAVIELERRLISK